MLQVCKECDILQSLKLEAKLLIDAIQSIQLRTCISFCICPICAVTMICGNNLLYMNTCVRCSCSTQQLFYVL